MQEKTRDFAGVVRIWLDKLTFFHIFLIWVAIIVAFGLIYVFSQNGASYLLYTIKNNPVASLKDSIYFSFVVATTTGFGDIVPFGYFKILAIFEVIFGILLIAIVTSKLVSIKQDAILSELYEISFKEKLNKFRSSFLWFRQNMDRLIDKVEDKTIQKREINSLYTFISSFEDIINDIITLATRSGKYHFIKSIDAVSAELIVNSVISSFDRIDELLGAMDKANIDWRSDINTLTLERCISANQELFEQLGTKVPFKRETINDLKDKNEKVINSIKIKIKPNV